VLEEHSDMGHNVNESTHHTLNLHYSANGALGIHPIPWLDAESDRFVRHTLALLIARREDLQSAVLFGSVARRRARPLTDSHPSDVDVLLIFDAEPGKTTISGAQHFAVSVAKVDVIDLYPDARDLQFALTLPTFAGWDGSFIENIARDGVLLWAREPLPVALHAIQKRADEDMLIK